MSTHADNIVLSRLSTGYKSRKTERIVSKRIDLSVLSGELVMLMGPNGCGKSTLMLTMAGLLQPMSGEITIAGRDMHSLRMSEKAKMFSLVLTDKIASSNLTVHDIVVIGRYPYVSYRGRLSAEDKRIVSESLTACRLTGFESRLYSELSDGEKQRVMIARALAQQTPVMLLDEPTAHLDLPSRLEVIAMLRDLARNTYKSILMSTHEMDLALQWADTVWLMDRGGVVTCGTPEDLVLNHAFERVFGNDKLSFDPELGAFSVKHSTAVPVLVEGCGASYKWTLNALHRNGFVETADTACTRKVLIQENGWLLQLENRSERHDSIGSLLHALHCVHK